MRRDLLIGLILAVLTLSAYWPVGTHGFIPYDDPQFISENPQITSGLSWATIKYGFTEPVVGNWHPLTTLSHALDCELFGVGPRAHHLVNAFIHSLNGAVLFLLIRQFVRGNKVRLAAAEKKQTSAPGTVEPVLQAEGVWLAAIVALLFALHPLRVESVAWVAERKDVLSGFFFLLSLCCYARYALVQTCHMEHAPADVAESGARPEFRPNRGRRAIWFYVLALVCFTLGLMSKPMVVTLPFVLLLMDFWPLRRFEISALKFRDSQRANKSEQSRLIKLLVEKLPFVLLSAIDCWITLRVQRNAGAMQVIQASSWERLANAITSYLRYLGKFFWPSDLSIVYPHPAKHYFLTDRWPDWEIVCAALLLVLITIFVFQQARRRPYALFGWLWFLGTLVPVIGLVQVGEQAIADRYTYIPLIGPTISLVWWIGEAGSCAVKHFKGMYLGRIAGVSAVVILLLLTRHQLGYWQDTVALFGHAINVTADNPSAQFAMGVGFERAGDIRRAMVHYRVATAIDPGYGKGFYNMGQLLRKQGYWSQAVDAYIAASRCSSKDLPTELNLASSLSHLGRNREAIAHFERALELDPDSIEALNNLAWVLATNPDPQLRDGSRAVRLAQHACAITGSKLPFLLGTLAAAYAEAGRFNEAMISAEQACARASEAGDQIAVARNHELLELYRAGKPYREQLN